jgi:hypothetical protein
MTRPNSDTPNGQTGNFLKNFLSARALSLSRSVDDAWDPADPSSWPPGTALNGSLGSKCAGLYVCAP